MNISFPWFRRFGILFLPATVPGWIVLVAAVSYAVWAFMDIDSLTSAAVVLLQGLPE